MMLSSLRTSQVRSWHWLGSLPVEAQRPDAWESFLSRTVAKMRALVFCSWRTNSRPMPLEAPTMSHVGLSVPCRMSGIWFMFVEDRTQLFYRAMSGEATTRLLTLTSKRVTEQQDEETREMVFS